MNITEKSSYKEVIPLDARLFYTVEGYSKIKVADAEYEMLPHSLLILNSGVPYRLMTPQLSVNYIAVNFDYTQNAAHWSIPIVPVPTDQFQEKMLVDPNCFDDTQALSTVFYIKDIPIIQDTLTAVVKEHMEKLLYFEQRSSHLLADCIAQSLRFQQISSISHNKSSSNRILAYIHLHYQEDLTNQSIGQVFGYHPNYVSVLVKHLTGEPLHRYIIHVRLMNAKALLENPALSINQIAAACGFGDAAYFSACFKQYFGISPSKYRIV